MASVRACTRTRRFPISAARGKGLRLREGMVLAIEPMVNAGKPGVQVLKDGWTAVTAGRQPERAFRAHCRCYGKTAR